MDPRRSDALSSGSAAEERRQITVLFCDIVDFTELASRLDPEELHQIVRAYEDCCAACVGQYDGHVFQRLGDGVVAFFGYPHAHESAAERAIHAALEILDRLAGLAVPGVPHLEVRIGIATGLVVVSADGRGAVGEPMSLAARLQGSARPGGVVISDRVRRLAGGAFDYADLGDLALKGISRPTRAWSVRGPGPASSRFEAARQGRLTPLVGRTAELECLEARWALARSGHGQAVVVSGEPGVGKSRILEALRDRLDPGRAPALTLQCSPHHQDSALWPVVDHLGRWLGFEHEDAGAERLARLDRAMAGQLGLADRDVHLAAELLSLPAEARYGPLGLGPQRRKEETLRMLVDLLIARSHAESAVLVFEDVHWADPTTVELLDRLVPALGDTALLAVLTHRPEFAPRWHATAHVTALPVTRLDPAETTAMVQELARGRDLPAALVDAIVGKSDGIPLFVEEITRSALESHALGETDARPEYAVSHASLSVPATLRDSLMARLDRFAAVKEIAQLGAAIGREFGRDLLAEVSPLPSGELDRALQGLERSGLAWRSGPDGAARYTFKHALVQDAAYESLLRSRRQALHGRIAQVLESRFREKADSEPGLLAHHWERAGEPAKAVAWHEAAGRRSLERTAMAEAARSFSHALRLLADLPEGQARDRAELRLRIALATTLMGLMGWAAEAVSEALEPVRGIARRLGDSEAILAATSQLAMWKYTRGEFVEAHAIAIELLDAGTRMDDARVRIAGALYAGLTSHYLGRPEESLRHAALVCALYTAERGASLVGTVNHDPKCFALFAASYSYWILGRYREARAACAELLRLARNIPQPWNLIWSLTGGSDVLAFMGDWPLHLQLIDEARTLARRHELPFVETIVCPFHEGETRIFAGDLEAGVASLREGLARWTGAGGLCEAVQAHAILADGLARLGRLDEAAADADAALRLMDRTQERHWEPEIHRIVGEIEAARPGNDPARVEARWRLALDLARERGARTWELRAALSLSRFRESRQRETEIRALLGPLLDAFDGEPETPDVAEARALLARATRLGSP